MSGRMAVFPSGRTATIAVPVAQSHVTRGAIIVLSKPCPPRPELDALIEKAKAHVMTPAERRAQRISFIVGQTGFDRDRVADWLDRHEGRK